MKLTHAHFRRATIGLCLALVVSHLGAREFSAKDLHDLYKQGRYLDCYRASAQSAKAHPSAAVPYFYAALSLTQSSGDSELRKRVRSPYGKALSHIEKARKVDPQGRKLGRLYRGLAVLQRDLVEAGIRAFRTEKSDVRGYFDRLAQVFDQRKGTWKNYYHHGRFLVEEDYDFTAWDNPYYRFADTGRDIPGISQEVRQIIYLHNLCRMNPALFRDTYLKQFLGGKLHAPGDHYVQTLVRDLTETEPRPPLYPDPQLIRAANYHAKDLSRNDIFQHASSDGTSFSKRIDRLAGDRGYCGENCAAGYDRAMGCFMGLLIDRGVESLGHRYNILREGFKYIGIGVSDEPEKWKIWVFDFAGN